MEIVRQSDVDKFVMLPRRWVAERTIAWLSHYRRLAKGLGRSRPSRTYLPPLGFHPLDGPKAISKHQMIPGGI